MVDSNESGGATTATRASILVVDDDAMLLRMTQIVLTEMGYDVSVAASGQEAISAIESADGRFGLVILDMRMPDMDGTAVLERVHGRWPRLKVLLVTGLASREVVLATTAKGAVGVLEKPYYPDTLADKVKTLLSKP
jgi:DNA-binding NtrC family response regulator